MTLVYLYGVVAPEGAASIVGAGLQGIGGGPLRAVAGPGVAGVVSDVPAAEFGQEALDRNVADTEWLAPHAAAHQDVNAALLDATGAVLPLAFGTIFHSDDRVREVLGARSAELVAGLAAVAGRVEWVATLDRDRRAASAYLAGTRSAPPPDAGQGKAYLLRRKAEVEGTEELRALDREARAAFRAAAAAAADDVSEEPIIEGGPAARFTVLVRREREAVLRRAAEGFASEWRARGYEPRLAGPWPAYRYSARLGSLHG